ncbi:LOW QUALITY PROTEIN: Hypothetical protein PHPALM_17066 [Phytophthora palmivora]|uniref:Uncharacterized protein n=1 Tax=Phytophthora palmivora TaxID=4796 RepID=A0A2P4XN57_9STRA|nr:LOW QUALITY PROTEIN: Hypothetical protein PHPALM_17066 [Phytophthora palmivora]
MIVYAHAPLVPTSSKMSPFFVDTGHQPKNPLVYGEISRGVCFTHHHKVIQRARNNLIEAQKKIYDCRRAANPFKVGDLVLLSTQDLNISHATAETTLRSWKFIPRFIGPYIKLELHGNVALLDLPANLKHLSPRFNIDKFKVYNSNPDCFAGRVIPKSTPVIFDGDGEPLHVVEALIKKRIFNRQPDYLAKWHGLPHHENTTRTRHQACQSLEGLTEGPSPGRLEPSKVLLKRGFTALFHTRGYYGAINFNFGDFNVSGAGTHSSLGECNDLHVQKQSNIPSSVEHAHRYPELPSAYSPWLRKRWVQLSHGQPLHVLRCAPRLLVGGRPWVKG